jgi:hypothetical protein
MLGEVSSPDLTQFFEVGWFVRLIGSALTVTALHIESQLSFQRLDPHLCRSLRSCWSRAREQ